MKQRKIKASDCEKSDETEYQEKVLRNKNKQRKSKRQGNDGAVSEESDESDEEERSDDLIGKGL